MQEKPFNPIEIPNIALSLALEVLDQPSHPLPPAETARGAGVYLLYYLGSFAPYEPYRLANSKDSPKIPIYIGKADRQGRRKGFTFDGVQGTELNARLRSHASSIDRVENLESEDFRCRYLSIEDAFIGLAESVLVSVFSPLWNRVLDGFGNNPTGGPRSLQAQSRWDLFHPGRRRGAGEELQTLESLNQAVADHFQTGSFEIESKLKAIRERIVRYGLG